jgi:hypothetical protein
MTTNKKKAAENEAAIAAFRDKQRRGEPSKMEYACHPTQILSVRVRDRTQHS